MANSNLNLSTLNGTNGFRINGIAANDYSGRSVSSAGDINGDGIDDLIIGAPLADPNVTDSGQSYVVFGSRSGFSTSLNLSNLNGTNGFKLNGINAYDRSGSSVSSAGDINGDGIDDLIIGADSADPNGSFSGQSYVVFGSRSGFSTSLNLSNLNGTNGFKLNGINAYDRSGSSVSSAGDINGDGIDDLMIGAPYAGPSFIQFGQSYVVFGSRSTFGSSINLSDLNGTNGFKINGIIAQDYSGRSVSSAGDINGDGIDDLIIGAWASPGGVRFGQSYIVFGSRSGFSSSFNLSTLNGTNGFKINGITAGDYSGRSLSSAGDINGDGIDDLIIGSTGADSNGYSNSGQSYVVFGSRSGFSASLNLSELNGGNGFKINGIAAGDNSGRSLSSAGDINGDGIDDLIIGSTGADSNGYSNSGRSYVVFGSRNGFSANLNLSTLKGTNGFLISGITDDDNSGGSVSGAGDINGDGIDDLIIGADRANPHGSNSGQSYVVYGNAAPELDLNGTNLIPGFKINGIAAYDYSGFSVSSAGDINGDGIGDLLIGARFADPNGNDSGQSYVVFGRRSGFGVNLNLSDLNGTNGFKISGVGADDRSGGSVSSAGDINGDGIDDLIIGANRADPNGPDSGQSYVVFGKLSGFSANLNLATLNSTNGFKINGIAAGHRSGSSVSSAGDINGDGIDDLIIGAPYTDPNNLNSSGQSYVVFGSRSGFGTNLNLSNLDGTNGFRINGIVAGDNSGTAVSSAGDINGDGIDDLLIGAPPADSTGNNSGQSYVVFGSRSTFGSSINLSNLSITSGFKLNGITYDRSGSSVSSAGDINGDGIDDLIIGASNSSPHGIYSGKSYVVFGSRSGFNFNTSLNILNGNGFKISGIAGSDFSGTSVSSAGDINGDGIDDLLIGATGADPNGSSSGQSYVVFGSRSSFGLNLNLNLSDLNGTNGFKINGIAADDFSGWSVSSAGDINGDGIDDLVIGAPFADPNGINGSGQSYVVFGRAGIGASGTLELNQLSGSHTNGIDFSTTFTGTPTAVVGTNLTLVDRNSPTLTGAKITITNSFNGAAETLSATTTGSITASYSTGVLTLSGIGTVAQYQQVLRSITYNNTAAVLSPITRKITFVVDDGASNSNTSIVATTSLTIARTTIEQTGAVELAVLNNRYIAIDKANSAVTSILYNGNPVTPTTFAGWSVVGTERVGDTPTGVIEYMWKNTAGQFWYSTNTNIGSAVAIGAQLLTKEIDFQQDFTGDGIIGAKTTIEQIGAVELAVANDQYIAIDKATNAVTSILFNGNPVTPTTFAGWSVVGAERVGDTPTREIEYMWKDNTTGQFFYSTNTNNGGYVAGAALIAKEVDFGQDFNGDGILPIEQFGAFDLAINSSNQYIAIDKATNAETSILYNGNPVSPTTSGGWSVIGAERVGDTSTGAIEYMWKDSTTGQFWYSTNTTTGGYVAGAALLTKETDFQQDFNNDRVIGLVPIETVGTTTLAVSSSGKYIANNGGANVELLYANSSYGPSTFPGWSVIGAEIIGAEVKAMWKNGSQYWYSTNTNDGISVTDTTPYEFTFKQDFDNDTFIAQVSTPANDTLNVTAGKDAFVFKGDPLSSLLISIGLDTVNNFIAGGQDRLFLSKANFTNISAAVGSSLGVADFVSVNTDAATLVGTPIVYNNANGKLFYDANGAAAGFGAGGQFAQLASGLGLTSNSFKAIA
jgi:FG-GAP repeat/Tryptophan-rich Synechocystis species C-terminal domain